MANYLLFWAKNSAVMGRMIEEGQMVKSVRFAADAPSLAAPTGPTTGTPPPPPRPHRRLSARATCPEFEDLAELAEARAACTRKFSVPLAATSAGPSTRPAAAATAAAAAAAAADSREGTPAAQDASTVSRSLTTPSFRESRDDKPGRQLDISPVQMTLVRKSWANAKTRGKVEPIANLFHHALCKCPDMRALLERSPTPTKDHVLLFLDLFESLMESLEDTTCVSLELREIGRGHVRLWEAGFRAAHFDLLAQSLLDATLKWGEKNQRTADCQHAWADICSFLVEELKEGFHEARKFAKRKASLKAF